MNAVFFDLDGTLFDTRRDLAATVNHTRRDLGLEELPVEDVLVHVGQGANYLLAHAIPEVSSEEVKKIFFSHYGEHMLETCEPYPGVRRTLEELKDRGWMLGVNTAKPNFATHAILEHFGFARFFGNAVIAGGDCDEMKPSAKPLRECAARMRGHRVTSHDWMVGDSWTDMECARNAGVKGAFCTFGFGKLKESSYNAKLSRMDELLKYCKEEE